MDMRRADKRVCTIKLESSKKKKQNQEDASALAHGLVRTQ